MANNSNINNENNNSQNTEQTEMQFGEYERQCCEFGIYCPKL
jgi:hypothetical protein